MFRDGFDRMLPPGSSPIRIFILAIAAVAALWLASGFYFIQPNQHGVVLTFGKYTKTEETSGLKYRLPAPFQTAQIVDVTSERRIEVGYRGEANRSSRSSMADILHESLMLTGDENIVDINFVVLWRISDARNYLFEIRDPEATIKIVAESAMREIIGRTKIQSALTEARTQVQADTRALMQQILDEYKSGVTINNVQLQKVDPPAEVVDAFNEVQRARQQKEELRNKAEAYRNDIIPRARGESEKLKQQAEGYKQEVISKATGDAARFTSVYETYQSAKTVTAERLYIETMENILQNAKIFVMSDGESASNLVPYLPMDKLERTTRTDNAGAAP
ncbi:MAG: FtsH protease activity modulator HflK [Alphaproteobacteria bacterium]|nr:FtsH protease activity modulator HflK [Alphaproteobacteria bacterium]